MPNESKDSKEPPKPVRLEGLSSRPSTMMGSSAGKASRGRFTPNMVNRRSKEDRESTAPAIKQEAKTEVKRQDQQQQRRKIRGGGARAEAAGPLAAPSTVDPRRPHGRSGGGGGGSGNFSRRTFTPSAPSADILKYGLEEGGLDVGATGTDRPFFPLRAQKKAATPNVATEETVVTEIEQISELEDDKLYLFELPKLDLQKTDEMSDSAEPATVQGQIGTLQYHKSGKVTLAVGDTIMDVTPGAHVRAIEDVVLVDSEVAHRLGHIDKRFVVIPDVSKY